MHIPDVWYISNGCCPHQPFFIIGYVVEPPIIMQLYLHVAILETFAIG